MNIEQWLMNKITLQTHDDRKDELFNAGTHLLGIIFSLVGTVLLLMRDNINISLQAGAVIYSLSMFSLYTSSTLYHFSQGPVAKRIFRIMDHVSIYFLIAGSYTAISVLLPEPLGSTIIAAVWGIAALGIVFTIVFWGRLKPLHVVIYLFMGWFIVFFWESFMKVMEGGLFHWILAGGLAYTGGTVVYASKKMPHYHAIWHLFVLAGTILQYIGIYLYVR